MKSEPCQLRAALHIRLLLLYFTACFMLLACNNQESCKRSMADLQTYVNNHRDSVNYYVDSSWSALDSGFTSRKTALDKCVNQMPEAMKGSFDSAMAGWDLFQREYSYRQQEKQKIAAMDDLRSSLTLEGVRPDFTDITPDNILKQYQKFVEVVKDNKDKYTQEQWTVVNVSWKSLNGRRREIEKDLHPGDEGKIMKLQLEYVGIKALNRPEAPNP
jgi:hypothetical protein